jgi:hypothetical protein
MAVIPLAPERFVQVQQALREVEAEAPRAEVVNEAAVMAIGQRRRLVYRGRAFEVDPVSYRDGQHLQSLTRAIAEASTNAGATDEGLEDIFTEAVGVFHRLVHPRSWRWRRNPFRVASEREVGELLGFFHSCRSRSGVRLEAQQRTGRRPR